MPAYVILAHEEGTYARRLLTAIMLKTEILSACEVSLLPDMV